MFRLGRVGEVRGTMTGRVEPEYGLVRPPPTLGETGCRTRGEDEFRVLGRDDVLRVLGRDDVLRVLGTEDEPRAVGMVEEPLELGRLRPLGAALPELDDGRPSLRPYEVVLGSTRVRVPPDEPPLEDVLPGR